MSNKNDPKSSLSVNIYKNMYFLNKAAIKSEKYLYIYFLLLLI